MLNSEEFIKSSIDSCFLFVRSFTLGGSLI